MLLAPAFDRYHACLCVLHSAKAVRHVRGTDRVGAYFDVVLDESHGSLPLCEEEVGVPYFLKVKVASLRWCGHVRPLVAR